jgi:hypothetical protein
MLKCSTFLEGLKQLSKRRFRLTRLKSGLLTNVLHFTLEAEDVALLGMFFGSVFFAWCVVALLTWLFKNFASVYFNGYCVFEDLA